MSRESHQDYADWVITGRRYYLTSEEWNEINNEAEEVVMVDNQYTRCTDCSKICPVLKLTTNTPSFHHSPEGICVNCNENVYNEPGRSMISEEEIKLDYWNCCHPDIAEQSKMLSKNLREIIQKLWIEEDKLNIYGMIEELHKQDMHKYCTEKEDEMHDWETY